jgi:type II secretory pathway component PulM
MTFIQYPFPVHDQNEPPPKGPGMSDREALHRIRPRTLRDKKFLRWMLVYLVLAVVFVILLHSVLHIGLQTRKDLHVTQAPAAYH